MLIETAKDRWNAEVENAVRWMQRTDWSEVREGMEGAISRFLGSGLQQSRARMEEVEKQAAPKVQEAVDRSKAAARKGADDAATGIDRAASATIAGAERAGAEAKAGASRIADSAKEQWDRASAKTAEIEDSAKAQTGRAIADAKAGARGATDSIKHSGGTIDASRGALRDAVHKGIEKGKEMIGKAEAAVGLATERVESKAQSSTLSHSSAVEKALHERYEKEDPLKKSVQEALEERYKPIDARDKTVLRGV
jgi:altered-inheritance-of-mitochondria protein 5